MNDKLKLIDKLLRDIVWSTHDMSDGKDGDYKNLDEVISYLETVKCVLSQKSLEYYLERIM